MHRKRRWCCSEVASAEELARMLTERTWTLCSGFYVKGHDDYLFLNDATHEDGAAEFSIVHGRIGADRHVQVESITYSWCSYEEALASVRQAIAGAYDAAEFAGTVSPTLETPAEHGRCPFCA